jgi:myo-inositol-1(or 4)-monophosphatase
MPKRLWLSFGICVIAIMHEPSHRFLERRDLTLTQLEHPWAQLAIESATLGAMALRSHFLGALTIESKGVANFVSSADLAAETAIVQEIKKHAPEHAIISEESHRDRADAEHAWIIDPLDGTSNFLHGIPHFAVSIGYCQGGVPALGVICNPVTEDWYAAAIGQGAWHNGHRVHVSDANELNQAMIAYGSYYDRGRMMQATLDTLAALYQAEIHGMRRIGAAALDLAYVACGQFEAFFEYRLSPWDYAAGMLLVTEAGGVVSDCLGNPLPLGRLSSVCASNGHLHAAMLAKMLPHAHSL